MEYLYERSGEWVEAELDLFVAPTDDGVLVFDNRSGNGMLVCLPTPTKEKEKPRRSVKRLWELLWKKEE